MQQINGEKRQLNNCWKFGMQSAHSSLVEFRELWKQTAGVVYRYSFPPQKNWGGRHNANIFVGFHVNARAAIG